MTKTLRRELEDGRTVAFIADQDAGPGGPFVPFLGRLASSYRSVAVLAVRFGVPVAAGGAVRRGNGFEYDVVCSDLIEPADWADHPDPVYYVTARYTRAIERLVRRVPEQYVWMYRRWRSRPAHEAAGEPMPAEDADLLRTLPWLDEAEIARLAAPAGPDASAN